VREQVLLLIFSKISGKAPLVRVRPRTRPT
jgi:hypothetical protein